MTETITVYVTLGSIQVVKEIGKHIISIGKLLKDEVILEGCESSIRISINGATLGFGENEGDGLYHTKIQRMNIVATDHCTKSQQLMMITSQSTGT